MKYFFNKLRFVKKGDVLAFILFFIALPCSFIYKMKRKHLWLVCERSNEARDNGYWFYKYLCEKHPEIDSVYAIKKVSEDYKHIKELNGNVIEFGSLKHWIYYLTAEINVSSQKEGKPNAAVCHFLEIYGMWKNRRVYLKHGIVVNDLKWHYYDVTKMWLYICSSKKEMNYCKKRFNYPENNVVLTGLCRFDNLDNHIMDNKTIFIMPTSREWLAHPIKEYQKYDDIYHFENTDFFKHWSDFLTNKSFNQMIENHNLEVIFFLHPTMQKNYTKYFQTLKTNAKIMINSDVNLQRMLKKAAVLITDYSSIFMDFAYMRKPELFFQFDYDKFREGHYQEGYFSYEKDGFGSVCYDSDSLFKELVKIVENDMKIEDKYKNRINDFFSFEDKNNCERTYKAIIDKLNNEKSAK